MYHQHTNVRNIAKTRPVMQKWKFFLHLRHRSHAPKDLHFSRYDMHVTDQKSSVWVGVGGKILSWREWRIFVRSISSDGRFPATLSKIFLSSVPSICCVVSAVSSAHLLMSALALVTWDSVCNRAWMCSCISFKNLFKNEELIFTLIPFLPINTLPHIGSFRKFLLWTYIYTCRYIHVSNCL